MLIRLLQERDVDQVVQLHGQCFAKLFVDVEPSSFHETCLKWLAAVQPQCCRWWRASATRLSHS